MRLRRLGFLSLVMAAVSLPVLPSAQANSYEAEIFSLVNGGRSSKLTSDSGLQAAARAHARQIAADGKLTSSDHGGAASRIGNSAPAGYTGTYCENLGYTNSPAVARDVYDGWRGSATHNACMHDSRMTVAGVGTYHDGNFWWVVMEFAQVRSSSSNNQSPQVAVPVSTPRPQAAKPTPRPQATVPVADKAEEIEAETVASTSSPSPEPTSTPEPEQSRKDVQALTEKETSIPPNDPVLGTREYAALGALLAFAGFVFFLARRRV